MDKLFSHVKIYTVFELTQEIKSTLEQTFPALWVEGEISNLSQPSSGHVYFTLKDESAQIRCVLWRNIAEYLPFQIEDGQHVIVLAKLSVYEKQGQYQLYVEDVHPVGIGKLELAFQQLKERLYKEGLFDEQHKQPIPKFPQRIGIVTSPTGAAIRDILKIARRRFPSVELILRPVRVQGEGAAEEIVQAIGEFNQFKEVDLLIVGRGGGSLEDLWAFNQEKVARAIFASRIPIVSAVGHEIDFTIADFVADLRAPTPSAAVEMILPDRKELAREIRNLSRRLVSAQQSLVDTSRQRLRSVLTSYGLKRPADVLFQNRQRLDELIRQIAVATSNLLQHAQQKFSTSVGRLNALSPLAVLERGYSVCYKLPERKIIKVAGSLKVKDNLEVLLWKGKVRSQVQAIYPE
jgi:exodeoxyribonuclease VII large subunit